MAYRNSGWDSFSPVPGTVESLNCRVCDSLMEVERNQEGATSWAESMAQKKHSFDHFYCKYSNERWHKQLLKLRRMIEDTPSITIANLLQEEVNQILKTKVATKEKFKEF